VKRSAEDEQFWRNEKEPAERWLAVRPPRNGSEYNDEARERVNTLFPSVGTEDEARAARGLPPLALCSCGRRDALDLYLRCSICAGAYRRQIEREKVESAELAVYAMHQMECV
jgi:hypothetical protein